MAHWQAVVSCGPQEGRLKVELADKLVRVTSNTTGMVHRNTIDNVELGPRVHCSQTGHALSVTRGQNTWNTANRDMCRELVKRD